MGGFFLLSGMMLGEVTPGGAGSGLYTILIYAIIAVFIGGLMIGRTPEYLGKKIQPKGMKLVGLGALVMPLIVLIFTAIAVSIHAGRAAPLNAIPHGFTEILYALTSQGNNNGSAFAGLGSNTTFYNVIGGIDMLIGRVGIMIPALALGGVLAEARRARRARHLPHRQLHVRRAHHRCHRHHRWPDLLPRPCSRPARRAAQPRKVLLMTITTPTGPARTGRPAARGGQVPEPLRWPDPAQGSGRHVLEAQPGGPDPQPGDVRRAGGNGDHLLGGDRPPVGVFTWSVTVWLFLTVIFANFAEAMAEGRGKAQADTLRKMRSETEARRLKADGTEELVPAAELNKGDMVVCEANDLIPSDGEIVEGIASVDQSAITGESAPVIRESGGDRSAVTGGTRVLSDRIVVRITASQGTPFSTA